jgi:hypothetical protein
MLNRLRGMLGNQTAEMISPHSTAVCIQRLKSACDDEAVWIGTKPVIGLFGPNWVRLRKRMRGRRTFQPTLRARFVEHGRTSLIVCWTGIPIWVWLFLAACLAAIGYGFVMALTRQAENSQREIDAWLTGFLLVLGIGLLAYGRWAMVKHREFLLNFLTATLQAKQDST